MTTATVTAIQIPRKWCISTARRHAGLYGLQLRRQSDGAFDVTRWVRVHAGPGRRAYRQVVLARSLTPDEVVKMCDGFDAIAAAAKENPS